MPNWAPDRETGTGGWAAGAIEGFRESVLPPDGDSAGGEMGEVIASSTGRMTAEDRRALVAYMRSLRPVENNLRQRPGS